MAPNKRRGGAVRRADHAVRLRYSRSPRACPASRLSPAVAGDHENGDERMTDVEIAEQAIAVLHDKLHTATKRAHEIAADRQRLSYAVFVDGDPSARADLEKLNAI